MYYFLFQEFCEIPFLKKFKFKRQDRAFPKDAPPATQTPSTASAAAATSAAPSVSSASTNNLTEVPTGQSFTPRIDQKKLDFFWFKPDWSTLEHKGRFFLSYYLKVCEFAKNNFKAPKSFGK